MSDTSSVVFHVPDFVDSDGIAYTDIEVIVETHSEGGIRDALTLMDTLEHPVKTVATPKNR
jgi:hypothetical protein